MFWSSAATIVGLAHGTGEWSTMNPQGAYYRRFLGRQGGFILWSGHRGHMLALDDSVEIYAISRLKPEYKS
jgi:hypothetical protein